MAFPDFLCIGAQKGGTTWLHAMLSQHPEIYLGPLKEYQFFNTLYVPLHRRWTKGHVMRGVKNQFKRHVNSEGKIDPNYVALLARMVDEDRMLTEDWYRDIFSVSEAKFKCRGDITPEYSTIPSSGIRHANRLMPDARIIYMIRDPYSRAMSQLKMNVTRLGGNPDMSEDEWSSWVSNPNIHNRGDYKTYIPRWEEVFGRDSILYIPFGDLKTNPQGVIHEVEDHIGVSPKEYAGIDGAVHKTKNIKVPASVKEKVRELVQPQFEFLSHHFGEDFVVRT